MSLAIVRASRLIEFPGKCKRAMVLTSLTIHAIRQLQLTRGFDLDQFFEVSAQETYFMVSKIRVVSNDEARLQQRLHN